MCRGWPPAVWYLSDSFWLSCGRRSYLDDAPTADTVCANALIKNLISYQSSQRWPTLQKLLALFNLSQDVRFFWICRFSLTFSHTPTLTDGSGALRRSNVKAAWRRWGRTFTCGLMASPADSVTDPLHINSKTHATHAHYQACMQTADYWYLQLLNRTTTLHRWYAEGEDAFIISMRTFEVEMF